MEQFNNLIEFRQAVYQHGFTRARDTQFELVDALLLGQPIRSFPELSLLPAFRRKMRRDRVLYGAPDSYSGRGRPRVHGGRFAFQEPETWGEPATMVELEHPRWGKVRLRRWDNKHARQDAGTPFTVILVETHLEREKPAAPFWLAYQPPPHQAPGDPRLEELWHWYAYRWPVESGIRFRKQYLNWTLPRFQRPEGCDRWTALVSLAQWQLFLGRDLVRDHPLPWQPAQENPTPERVLQGFGGIFPRLALRPRHRKGAESRQAGPRGDREPHLSVIG